MVSVCDIYLAALRWSALDHFKLVDGVLGVGPPDCATVLQYGSDERKICSGFCRFIADLKVSSQEAYHTVSIHSLESGSYAYSKPCLIAFLHQEIVLNPLM